MANASHASRQKLVEGLDQLKVEGVLGEADQGTLVRHLDEQRELLEARIAEVVPEYQRRLLSEGEAAANAWLERTARMLGEEQGRAARGVVGQLDVTRNL